MITCTFEDGGKGELRHVTVNSYILNEKNQLILGKRGTFHNGKKLQEYGKWGAIGGFFDRDENLIEAVKREAMEEIGAEITDLKLIFVNDSPHRPHEADRQNLEFGFVAKLVSMDPQDCEEILEWKWFDLDDLPSDDEIAFDHEKTIKILKKYLRKEINVPVIFSQTEEA